MKTAPLALSPYTCYSWSMANYIDELRSMSDLELANTWRALCDWPSKTPAHEALILAQVDAAAAELARRGYATVIDYPR